MYGIMWDLNGDLISEYAKSVEYFLINHPQGVFKQDRDPIVPLSISLEIDGTGGLYLWCLIHYKLSTKSLCLKIVSL